MEGGSRIARRRCVERLFLHRLQLPRCITHGERGDVRNGASYEVRVSGARRPRPVVNRERKDGGETALLSPSQPFSNLSSKHPAGFELVQ